MKVRYPNKDTTGIDLTRSDYIDLRDYFAAKAMQSLLSSSRRGLSPKDYSQTSYQIADAMMDQRSK